MLLKFHVGKVGSKAYTLSNVWKLGIHLFEIPECIVFRVCYLRTNKHKSTKNTSLDVKVFRDKLNKKESSTCVD